MLTTKAILVLSILIATQAILNAQVTTKTPRPATNKQNSKITTTIFEGVWRGTEKCQNISAPVATITITEKSATEVIITGIYSTTGNVIATLKNNILTIPLQQIPDPIFMEMRIEGNLTLSKNRKLLSGIVIISNHDARDNCGVLYQRR